MKVRKTSVLLSVELSYRRRELELVQTKRMQVWLKLLTTDYGCPKKHFSIEIQNFWTWVENWADRFWGIWGIFDQTTISTHFGTVSPLFMFSIIQPLFLQKNKSLYSHPRYLFEIEILIWAAKNQGFSLVCPLSMLPTMITQELALPLGYYLAEWAISLAFSSSQK